MGGKDRIDRLLLTSLAVVATAVAFLLVFDIQLFVKQSPRVSSEASIATLSTVSSSVRRKARGVPLWDSAAADEALFTRDAIFTDEAASATVRFGDQTTIELGESTLIAIEKTETNAVVNVIKGSLRLASDLTQASQISLKVAGEEAPIHLSGAATLSLTVERGKPAKIRVLSGQAEVGTARTKVTAGQVAHVARADAPVTVAEQAVVLLKPAHDERQVLQLGDRIAFTYRIKGAVGRIEIARDAAFRRIVAAWAAIEPSFAAPTEGWASGTYYWRVRTAEEVSEVRRLTLVVTGPPELVVPADGAQLKGEHPTAQLQWEGDGRAFIVEWSPDPTFMRNVQRSTTQKNSVTTAGIAGGRYYWRVREQANQNSLWSAVRSFTAVIEAARPAAPVLGGASQVPPAAPIVSPLPDVTPVSALVPYRSDLGASGDSDRCRYLGATREHIGHLRLRSNDGSDVELNSQRRQDRCGTVLGVSTPGAAIDDATKTLVDTTAATKDLPAAVTVSGGGTDDVVKLPDPTEEVPPPASAKAKSDPPLPLATASPKAAIPAPIPLAASTPGVRMSEPEHLSDAFSRRETLSVSAGFTPTFLHYQASTSVRATLFNSYRLGANLSLSERWGADASLLRTSTILFRTAQADDPPDQMPLLIQPFSTAAAARLRLLASTAFYLDGRLGVDAENLVRFHQTSVGTLSVHHVLAYGPMLGAEFGLLSFADALLIRLGGAYFKGIGSARQELAQANTVLGYGTAQLYRDPLPFALRLGLELRRQQFTPATVDADVSSPVAIETSSLLLELIWQVL